MTYTYRLHPLADEDYVNSYLWYEEQEPGLGDRFIQAVATRLRDIVENPEHYGKKKGEYREIIVDDVFPFLIVYRIKKTDRVIIVSSIFHTKRSPKGKYRK